MNEEELQENNEEENNESQEEEKIEETQEEVSDEVVVSIGDEKPQVENEEEEVKKAPEWVRDLRKNYKELQREKRELETKLNAFSQQQVEKPIELPKKPKLEDFEYDAEKFEKELESWYIKKQEIDNRQRKKQQEEEQVQQEYNKKLEMYHKKKLELKVKDFDDIEEAVKTNFSKTQQGIMVSGADNPALVAYALGKNPNKMKELSEIKDPVKFAFAIAKLETQLKITTRKPSSEPEKVITSSGMGTVLTSDKTLDRLRAEADKTGDFTKVSAYKRQLKTKK